ncbi:MAG: VOC family protein [Gammaproteobacteria bacterium]|nr:VOC family protein [Gammaproteobacteria bacterium]
MIGTAPFDAQVTFCYSQDLSATAHFYEQLLELPLSLDQGDCRIYRVAPAAHLGFCQRADAPRPQGVILTLVSDAVDEWYTRLSARGAVFEKPPAHNSDYFIYRCLLRDPNGYLLEIQRFEDPAWYA